MTEQAEQAEKSVETKLGELMLQGWTMLADCCFMESCQTPLMRDNVTKQIYCVGCEAWVFVKEKTKKELKYTDLVSLEGKRGMQTKNHNEITSVTKPVYTGAYNLTSFRDVLEAKMIEFSGWLQVEKDITKCNSILDAMKKTLEMLKEFKK